MTKNVDVRTYGKVCTISGKSFPGNVDNFYSNQSHVKAVDNIRRATSATKQQLQHMFNQLNNY